MESELILLATAGSIGYSAFMVGKCYLCQRFLFMQVANE